MATESVNGKGQITLPAAVRQAMQVGTGDRVEFVEIEPGRHEFIAATRPVTALKGIFGKAKKTVSVEHMNAAIAAAAARATGSGWIPMCWRATSCATMPCERPRLRRWLNA